jgi:hypothetical protein
MRIEFVQPSVNLPETAKVENIIPALKNGETLQAKVLAQNGENATFKSTDGRVFTAKVLAELMLSVGDNVELYVRGKSANGMALQVVSVDSAKARAASPEDALIKSLREKYGGSVVEAVQLLNKINIKPTAARVSAVFELMNKNPSLDVKAAVFFTANNIEPSAENIRAFLSLVKSGSPIGTQLYRLMLGLAEDGETEAVWTQGLEQDAKAPGSTPEQNAASTGRLPEKSTATPAQAEGGGAQPAPLQGPKEGMQAPQIAAEGMQAPQIAAEGVPPGQAEDPAQGEKAAPVRGEAVTAPQGEVPAKTAVPEAGTDGRNVPGSGGNTAPPGAKAPENAGQATMPDGAKNILPDKGGIGIMEKGEPTAAPGVPPDNAALQAADIPPKDVRSPQTPQEPSAWEEPGGMQAGAQDTKAGVLEIAKKIFSMFADIGDAKDITELENQRLHMLEKLSDLKSMVQNSDVKGREAHLARLDETLAQAKLAADIDRFVCMHIPIQQNGAFSTAEVYIYKRKQRGGKIDAENTVIQIGLDTLHMGRVEALIRVENRNVALTFKMDREEAMQAMKGKASGLYKGFKEIGYNLKDTQVVKLERRTTVAEAEEELTQAAVKTPVLLDYRI